MKFVSIKKLLDVSIFSVVMLMVQTVQADTSGTKIEHQTEDIQLITKDHNTKKQINDSKLTNNTSDNNDKKKVLEENNKGNSNIAKNDRNMEMEDKTNNINIQNNTIVLEEVKTENNNMKSYDKTNNINRKYYTKKLYEKITQNNSNNEIARNDNDTKANDKINNTNNKKDVNKTVIKSEANSNRNKLEVNLTNNKNISTQNSKSNINNTGNKSFEKTIKKESMEFIIWNLKLLEDLEQEIKEVFCTNKYDENIDSNLHTKNKLLDMIKDIRNVYESIDDITIDTIKKRFNYIFEELICIISGTNWRYNHGFIESTKPYEILMDYISYFTRLYANVLYYKQGTRTKGCGFFN